MARGFTWQTVLLAMLLAAMAGSQIALADQDDESDEMVEVPVTVGRRQIRQPARLASARTVRPAVLDQSDDDAPAGPPVPSGTSAKPWSEDVSPAAQRD